MSEKHTKTISVEGTEITILQIDDTDYICITDMLKAKDGDFVVKDWLRNRNTLEFLGIWEKVYNPDFNWGEFALIRNQAGLNRFRISVKEYVEKTNAIGLKARAGRYGGTYAHKDIAFEFAMWISPEFKVYLVRDFQRLKEQEQARLAELTEQNHQQEQQAAALGKQIEKIRNQQVDVATIEKIESKPIPFSTKIAVEREDFERLSTLAKKYITAEKKESKLQKTLDAANRLIAKLKAEINSLQQELSEYKSVRSKLRTPDLERENAELRGKVQRYENVIQRNNLWHFFRPRREKTAMRDDAR